MTKDKKGTWGGKRPNQTGRPTLGDSPRVQLHAMIDPATKDRLNKESRRSGKSRGQVIDEIAKTLK
jgi:hypothetical protein